MTPADRLARMREDLRLHDAQADRPRALVLGEDVHRRVEVPAPNRLGREVLVPLLLEAVEGAERLARDGADVVFVDADGAVLARYTPEGLGGFFLEWAAMLPERAGVNEPYRAVRLAALEGRPEEPTDEGRAVRAFWTSVGAAVRRQARAYTVPKALRPPRPAPKTGAERQAAYVAAKADAETATSRWVLECMLADGREDEDAPLRPGERIASADLFTEALGYFDRIESEVRDSWGTVDVYDRPPFPAYLAEVLAEDAAAMGEPAPPERVARPGRRRFHAVAREVLGEPRRLSDGRFFVIPA